MGVSRAVTKTWSRVKFYLQVSPDSNLGTMFQSPWFSPLGYTGFHCSVLRPLGHSPYSDLRELVSLQSAVSDAGTVSCPRRSCLPHLLPTSTLTSLPTASSPLGGSGLQCGLLPCRDSWAQPGSRGCWGSYISHRMTC